MTPSYPPGAIFQAQLLENQERAPIPNDVLVLVDVLGSSRRDFSNANLFGTDAIPTVEISTMETSAQGGVIYTDRL